MTAGPMLKMMLEMMFSLRCIPVIAELPKLGCGRIALLNMVNAIARESR